MSLFLQIVLWIFAVTGFLLCAAGLFLILGYFSTAKTFCEAEPPKPVTLENRVCPRCQTVYSYFSNRIRFYCKECRRIQGVRRLKGDD